MNREGTIEVLSDEETNIHRYWTDIMEDFRRHTHFIDIKKFRRELGKLDGEVSKVAYLIRSLHSDRRGNTYLRHFLKSLKKAEAPGYISKRKIRERWLKRACSDIEEVFEEIDDEKRDLKEGKMGLSKRALYLRYRGKFRKLKKWGFPVRKHFELGLFLVKHWNDTMVFRAGFDEYNELFHKGFPAVADLINEENWEEIIQFKFEVGSYQLYYVLAYGIPVVRDIISEFGFKSVLDDFKKIVRIAPTNYRPLLIQGFPNISDLISVGTWSGIMRMINASKNSSFALLAHGLPKVKEIINRDTWEGLVRLVEVSGPYSDLLFIFTLPAIKHIIRPDNWGEIEIGLRNLAFRKEESEWLFARGSPSVKDIITSENWQEVFEKLLEGEKSGDLFSPDGNHDPTISKALPFVRHIITRGNFNFIFRELKSIKDSAPKCSKEVLLYGLSSVQHIINKDNFINIFNGLKDIAKKSSRYNNDRPYISGLIFRCLYLIKHTITEENFDRVISVFDQIINFIESIFYREIIPLLDYFIPKFSVSIRNLGDFEETWNVYMSNYRFLKKVNIDILVMGLNFKKGLKYAIDRYRERMSDARYVTFQGLNSLGFLCCHVTNAFSGGAAGGKEKKSDPFGNIIYNIENPDSYNPSCSIIKRDGYYRLLEIEKMVWSEMVEWTDEFEIGGSIGVVFDYGYIYESYIKDAKTYDGVDEETKRSYRTGHVDRREPIVSVMKFNRSLYNEVLPQKWTASGIFYTRGCKDSVIQRLIEISQNLSGKEYFNGEHWYNRGAPEKIIKWFPVIEIDNTSMTWRTVFDPKPKNYRERIRGKVGEVLQRLR
jgi:hypothetical protein